MENLGKETIKEIERVFNLLMELQPHIPQSCIPGHEGFIDNYVDPAIDILRSILNKR